MMFEIMLQGASYGTRERTFNKVFFKWENIYKGIYYNEQKLVMIFEIIKQSI